jgi:hypothetical protein
MCVQSLALLLPCYSTPIDPRGPISASQPPPRQPSWRHPTKVRSIIELSPQVLQMTNIRLLTDLLRLSDPSLGGANAQAVRALLRPP